MPATSSVLRIGEPDTVQAAWRPQLPAHLAQAQSLPELDLRSPWQYSSRDLNEHALSLLHVARRDRLVQSLVLRMALSRAAPMSSVSESGLTTGA
jgi:hypothetical protein